MRINADKLRALVKSRGLTNTKLAHRAGITRQALQTMLREDRRVDVRPKTVKGLAQALRLPDESLLSADPLMRFSEKVAQQCSELTFRGLGLPTAEARPLDELFVPIRLFRTAEPEPDRDCQGAAGKTEEKSIPESDELTVAGCLALHRRVLVSGEPGSGKTTALRHTARVHSTAQGGKRGSPREVRIPLLVGLADFAKAREGDNDISLVRFVVTRTLRDASPEYWTEVEHQIELELQKGGCLVLLDGLDEISANVHLIAVLRRFIGDHSRNQFVITSRLVGLDEGLCRELGFAMFQVARWREKDIRDFAHRWYAGPSGIKGRRKQHDPRAEDLTSTILGSESLRAIASNPLMLTILAALHHANANLPRRRVDVYAKIVEVMFETWEASKRGARPGDPLHGILLEAREFGWLLDRLALGMQREGRLIRPRWWVNDVMQQFLRDQTTLDGDLIKEQGERVIRYLCERTGLLVERGDGAFGFYHRTFQEYFAARGLLLEAEGGGDIVALLRPYLFHPQWEEVLVHVAASVSAPRATALLRAILDDPDPAGRFLHRGQRLAMRCLVEGAAVADRVILDQVFSNGPALGGSRWLGIAIGYINLLKQLRLTRHEAEARRMLDEIEEAAKKELSESEFLTVYLSSHDPPDEPREYAPGTVCRKRLGGRQVQLVWMGCDKRINDPDSWYADVLKLVRNPNTELSRRVVLISFLGFEADSHDKARRALEKMLLKDRDAPVRAECAEALEEAAAAHPSVVRLLLDCLKKDQSDMVRKRCAGALRGAAVNDRGVRERLEEVFASAPALVRAGAAAGLAGLDLALPEQNELLARFLNTITSSREPPRVRHACIWAVASLLGREGMERVDEVIQDCLADQDQCVSKTALHVLADAIADGRQEWSQPLVARIEKMLMAVTEPCPHLFRDLLAIVALKEIHGGLRLERLLGDALDPFAALIRIAFVFGSVARLEQVRDSDVDLMVIGEVRLKELAAALHACEQILGRAVNPVLFSPQKFREQYREGNPFLLDLVRKEKIFLRGSRDELTQLVADRSCDQA